jgi:AsmA family protein
MNRALGLLRGLKWLGWTLLALLALLLAAAAALDLGYFRGALVKLLATAADRPIQVAGVLRLQILSLNPRLVAERVTIGSPPWTPPAVAAEVGKITVVFATPRLGRELIIERLEIEDATLHLFRDATGHANWQLKNPDKSIPRGLPIIRSLLVSPVRVRLDDAQQHRQFDGTVLVQDAKGKDPALHIEAKGQLNGRAVNAEMTGDPLRTASHDQHYAFSFSVRSSGSHLTGSGFLLQPFDLRRFDVNFEASGADLRDMYYLTGTRWVDTASYRLSGKLARRGVTSSFTDVSLSFGQSDVRGTISIEGSPGQSTIRAILNSQSLRMSDVGARAAGRDIEPQANAALLLPSAAPDTSALRRNAANVEYHARSVQAGRLTLGAVAMKITNDHGQLVLAPVSADLLGGKLHGAVRIDARKETPAVSLEVSIADLQLGQYVGKKGGPPAIEGPLQLRANLRGLGKSLHEAAASIEGTVTATLPSGMVRDSLAELTGIDLRGLGLLLAKDKKEVPVRCGIASFQAHDGTLTAQKLVLDTEPVVITGEGVARLDTEALDFTLRGFPKNMRILQLRSPIVIQGTLKAPSFGIQAHDSKLVLVDPGKAQNVDCESLLQ